jgi:UDP-N-acetylglucosamine--N-acetylmuramyl-(pentapeptide) pyrophosphoryl-undecaprenol N-acetylglucosamine transferase
MKLMVCAGGTGGHIFPGIAVAEAFLAQSGENKVVFVGTESGLEKRIVPEQGFRLLFISAKPFLGKGLLQKAATPFGLVRTILQAMALIRSERPDAILGMGAFTSFPVVIAGRLMNVPCFLHEQNVYPGLSNRLLAPYVAAVFISFDASRNYVRGKKIIHTGNPVRRDIRIDKGQSDKAFFDIFVFGGSRGARSINEAVLLLLPHLESYKNARVYHQTGNEDYDRVKKAYNGTGIVHDVFPFTKEMGKYYTLASVVIARAGASTIFELSYFGKPAILVPYPFAAGGHQSKNAEYVEKKGGGLVIENAKLSGDALNRLLDQLRQDPERLAEMGRRMGEIYVEGAEERIARGIIGSVS